MFDLTMAVLLGAACGAEIEELPSNFPAIVLITCSQQRAAVHKHSASISDIIR